MMTYNCSNFWSYSLDFFHLHLSVAGGGGGGGGTIIY